MFPQDEGAALSELGEAAVRAMYERKVLVDISHMRDDAIDETFALIEALDAQTGRDPRAYPVIASHAGYRFGGQKYNLSDRTIVRIAARGGVVGLIFAQHQITDGLRRTETKTLDESVAILARHIDAIGPRHVALGSDLDGFIKPTLGGIDTAADLAPLAAALRARYPAEADDILDNNTRRVLAAVPGGWNVLGVTLTRRVAWPPKFPPRPLPLTAHRRGAAAPPPPTALRSAPSRPATHPPPPPRAGSLRPARDAARSPRPGARGPSLLPPRAPLAARRPGRPAARAPPAPPPARRYTPPPLSSSRRSLSSIYTSAPPPASPLWGGGGPLAPPPPRPPPPHTRPPASRAAPGPPHPAAPPALPPPLPASTPPAE